MTSTSCAPLLPVFAVTTTPSAMARRCATTPDQSKATSTASNDQATDVRRANLDLLRKRVLLA
jgi:hypothetical protein